MTLAPRTLVAYRSDWSHFARWCAARHEAALPARATTVVAYVEDLAATRRVSTLQRRLAAIRAVHLAAGLDAATDTPAVTTTMARARWRQRHLVGDTTPITVAELRRMSRALPPTLAGARDRAVLLVGFGAALRPGELVALGVSDVAVGRHGLRVESGRGGLRVPFGSAPELCAVTAWTAWARAGRLTAGPAFRAVDRHGRVGAEPLGEKAVGRIVRRSATAAGLDATRFTGRSLRRGMVDAAVANGTSRTAIMRQTGHRSARLVRSYIEAAGWSRDPSGDRIG